MSQKQLLNLLPRFLFLVLIFTTHTVRAEQTACDGEFYLKDLQVEHLKIAYQDVSHLLAILSTLGYETVSMEGAASPATQLSGSSSYRPPTTSGSYRPPMTSGSYRPPMTSGSSMPGQVPGQTGGSFQRSYSATGQSSPFNPMSPSTGPTAQPELESKKKYRCEQLPVVVSPPAVADSRLGFDAADFLGLGGGGSTGGSSSFGGSRSSSSQVSGDISPALHNLSKPHSGEVDHLLVFYHESQEADLRQLNALVKRKLDVPATQIYIEGLVLEVSAEGLDELGVQYQRVDPKSGRNISIGGISASPVSAGGSAVVDLVRDSLLDTTGLANRSLLQIQALISQGEAEVLSRPSVLTLSNRQATIQIIDIVQFPIQEATITSSGDIVQSAFKFEAVRPGITLNLRPRVTSDLKFVSMEIDVTVEALVSANNGEVRNDQGQVIATKPGSSTRRVQTFARIPDRTPIIVGGLISSDKETVKNRVPLLGRIPGIGRLFGATKKSVGKREVIIVLTPYVVGEQNSLADVSVPKDTSLFDTSDAALFQNSYRVRAEDIYDLKFLRESPTFMQNQALSEQIFEEDPRHAAEGPYRWFLDGNVPGGDKFLNRMMYDLVRRRGFGSDLTHDQLIVIEKNSEGNAQVALVQHLADRLAASGGKALYLVFGTSEREDQAANIDISPIPAGESWSDQLWNLSYGRPNGTGGTGIIIRGEQDLDILVDAMKTSAIIARNGGYDNLTVGRFSTGTLFSIPSFAADRFYVVDEKVARVFTDIQHYYRASARDLEETYRQMNELNPESSHH